MAAAKSGPSKVGNFIVLKARRLQSINRRLEHRPLDRFIGHAQYSLRAQRIKLRPLFPRQAVHRHMLHAERYYRFEILLDCSKRLTRRSNQ